MDQKNENNEHLKEFGRIMGWSGAILLVSHLIVSVVESKTGR